MKGYMQVGPRIGGKIWIPDLSVLVGKGEGGNITIDEANSQIMSMESKVIDVPDEIVSLINQIRDASGDLRRWFHYKR